MTDSQPPDGAGGKRAGGQDGPPPPVVRRDPTTGRLLPGSASLNPGGRPRAERELAELARSYLPAAFERAVGMLDDADPKVQAVGVDFVFRQGLGRTGSLADLMASVPASEVKDDSNAGILRDLRAGLAHRARTLRERVAAGVSTADDTREAVELVRAFQGLAEEGRTQAKAGGADGLTDAELAARVLQAMPDTALREELARRDTSNGGHPGSDSNSSG